MASERRLVDANVFWNRLRQVVYDIAENDDSGRLQLGYSPDIIEEVLKQTPTVDAVEVVHGQWKNITDFGNGDCYGFCSACATEQHAQNASALKAFHRYCRWCGAKMDGERKDNG